jgi:hypothetical protein
MRGECIARHRQVFARRREVQRPRARVRLVAIGCKLKPPVEFREGGTRILGWVSSGRVIPELGRIIADRQLGRPVKHHRAVEGI